MPAVLIATSVLVCAHNAPVVVNPGRLELTVDGRPVLVRADLIGAAIPACPATNACGAIASIDAGLAGTLRVGDEPVVLDGATGATAFATWRVESAGQTKLEAT